MNKSWNIAYFTSIIYEPWAQLPWLGAVEEAKSRNINLFTFPGEAFKSKNGFLEQGNIIYELARSNKIHGLVSWKGNLTLELSDRELEDYLSGFNVPVVLMEGSLKAFPMVDYGNYHGMKMNIKHLVQIHGFNKIAYLGLVPGHKGYEDRFKGYKDGLKENGLNFDEGLVRPWLLWVSEVDGVPSSQLLDNWLKERVAKGMQAIIGACDPIAVWIIERLEALGYRVPEDVSVCGFDGFDEYQVLKRPLTTIDPDWMGLGRTAVKVMLDILEKRKVEQVNTVPAIQKIAKTCGCMEKEVVMAAYQALPYLGRVIRLPVMKKMIRQLLGELAGEKGAEIADKLLYFYISDVKTSKVSFVQEFDSVLTHYSEKLEDFKLWHIFITHLQKNNEILFVFKKHLGKASALCQQARILITNALQRFKSRENSQKRLKIAAQRNLGTELITAFTQDELCRILEKGVVQLNINSCYLYLYDGPGAYHFYDALPEYSYLILAMKDGKRVNIGDGQKRIKSTQIVPDDIFINSPPANYCVYSLYSRDSQIGYLVFESPIPDEEAYEFIAKQVASGLMGILLLKKLDNHSRVLSDGIEELSSAVEQIVRNIENIFTTMNMQGQAVSDEASAIEEMRSNINRIAELSDKTAELSNQLDDDADNGAASVKNLVNAIQGIRQRSDNILSLSTLIQDIADKTKLLAFNAAVEAAHAGKGGVGFNIVSKEIRKLAEETENNIRGISSELDTLLKLIRQSGALAEDTILRLGSIIDSTRVTSDLNTQLNYAMKEQDRGVQEILKTTQSLVQITAEINTSMTEQRAVTKDFKDTITKLNEIAD
ncbi:MAG: substrate-binding domain-containing protein [Spirochaetales bacterium]|nr:substrate-binding domain-containing protein [Spirochaetales bacterium]